MTARLFIAARVRELFWARVDHEGPNGCWLWTGNRDLDGYGRIMVRRKTYKAHRLSYELNVGSADGMCVCHRCDVFVPPGDSSYRRCVNPDHLFLGTMRENGQDMVSKRRQPIGSKHGNAKLTEETVLAIWARKGTASPRVVGLAFGVTGPCVWQIWHGRSWRHLNLWAAWEKSVVDACAQVRAASDEFARATTDACAAIRGDE